jgi:hypothetical protein
VDEARLAENAAAVDRICPSYEELGSDVEARIGEFSTDTQQSEVLTYDKPNSSEDCNET